jgi:hypothetical protein
MRWPRQPFNLLVGHFRWKGKLYKLNHLAATAPSALVDGGRRMAWRAHEVSAPTIFGLVWPRWVADGQQRIDGTLYACVAQAIVCCPWTRCRRSTPSSFVIIHHTKQAGSRDKAGRQCLLLLLCLFKDTVVVLCLVEVAAAAAAAASAAS